MTDSAMSLGVIFETTVFLHYFSNLPDSRQPGKLVYPLNEMLLLSLLGGAESFTDIARFGEKKLGLLRRFLPFADGTPPHDRLGEIFAALDASAFQRCFVEWVAALTKTPSERLSLTVNVRSVEVIAIDGKTMRGTKAGKDSKAAIHMVSAFAARQRLVLAQVKVDAKSSEIVAIPALLDLLAIEGAVVRSERLS